MPQNAPSEAWYPMVLDYNRPGGWRLDLNVVPPTCREHDGELHGGGDDKALGFQRNGHERLERLHGERA